MHSNRMLYAPGIEPYDPNTSSKASFLPFAEIPHSINFGLVAVCHLSLNERLNELGLTCDREYNELEGGWYRIMGIKLPSDRLAFVQEFEHHPGDVNLHLVTWRELHLYRQDFFAARELLALQDTQITLCDGPFLWR